MSRERQFPCEPRGDLSWLEPELKRHGYDNPHIELRDGRLYFGTDPWAQCDWCASVRDTGEFYACPFCLAETEKRERREGGDPVRGPLRIVCPDAVSLKEQIEHMALKDCAATVFGTTSTAGTGTSTLPVISVDDHPDWQGHCRHREELASKLCAAEEDMHRLQRDRAQAEHDVWEADVLRLLGDNVATMAPDAIAVDASLATARARVATIAEALKRLDARGADLRARIEGKMCVAIEASARDVVKNLGQTLRAASELSDELARLQHYGIVTLPVHSWHELSGANEYSRLNQWLASVHAAGWDV